MDKVNISAMTAYCGLSCSTCEIYMATRESDPAKREMEKEGIAAAIHALYGKDLAAGQVADCDGCKTSTGRLFPSCAECRVRECARDRKIDSCAFCPDYACDKLRSLLLSENGCTNGSGMAEESD